MASFAYLWKHRAKFAFGSRSFWRAWAKRVFTFPEIYRRNYRRNRLIRKGARVSPTAEIGSVDAQGKINFLEIGDRSTLGRVVLALHGPITIGCRVCINDGVQLLTASHDVFDPQWKHKVGPILIEDFAWIGTAAIILPGVTIGRGAVVGAGAVVAKSVPAGRIVVGNPARIVDHERSHELDYDPCGFLAGNEAWLKG